MNRAQRTVVPSIVVCFLLGFCGQDAQSADLKLPNEPSQWLNSSPLSLETLKGKAAVLWFFEEQ